MTVPLTSSKLTSYTIFYIYLAFTVTEFYELCTLYWKDFGSKLVSLYESAWIWQFGSAKILQLLILWWNRWDSEVWGCCCGLVLAHSKMGTRPVIVCETLNRPTITASVAFQWCHVWWWFPHQPRDHWPNLQNNQTKKAFLMLIFCLSADSAHEHPQSSWPQLWSEEEIKF